MKKRRIIPVLLLRNGWLVQSKQFRRWQNLGNPITAVQRLSDWASDELIYLDISREGSYDMRREDLGGPNRASLFEIIEDVSKVAFMPLTFGGGIRSLGDIEDRLSRGADKVSINSAAVDDPGFVDAASREFGSQCIVVSIDYRTIDDRPVVVTRYGTQVTEREVLPWSSEVQERGAGEILLNSIERDGMRTGYDLALIDAVARSVEIPVIALGGVGNWDHLARGLSETKADAVAAANIFHYTDQSVYLARKHLSDLGLDVRPADLLKF